MYKLISAGIMMVMLAACATTQDASRDSLMNAPMQAENEPEFLAYLEELESGLEPREFLAVKDAIAVLFVGDWKSENRNAFFRSRIDGRTPNELIVEARPVRQRYGIKKPQELTDADS